MPEDDTNGKGENSPFLTVDLGQSGGTKRFASFEDVKAFIDGEKSYWSWFTSKNRAPPIREVAERIAHHFQHLDQALSAVQPSPEHEAIDTKNLQSLRKYIEQTFKNAQKLPLSTSPEGEFIRTIKSEFDHDIAAGTVTMLVGHQPLEKPQLGSMVGAIYLFHSKFDGMVAPHVASLEKLRNEWQENLTRLIDELNADNRNRSQQFQSLVDEWGKSRKDQDNSEAKRKKDFDAFLAEHKAIGAIKEPASYWAAKRSRHWVSAALTGAAALAAGLGGGLYLFDLGTDAQTGIAEIAQAGGDVSLWTILPYSFPVIVVATGVFWLLRVLVRLCLSNIHLATDASERVVMTQTFLSLLIDKGAVDPKRDLHVILAELFRSTPTGIVKDDASPPMAKLWLERATND